jgi:hypothetical protein
VIMLFSVLCTGAEHVKIMPCGPHMCFTEAVLNIGLIEIKIFIFWLTLTNLMKHSSTSGSTEVNSDPAVYNDSVSRWAGLPVLLTT